MGRRDERWDEIERGGTEEEVEGKGNVGVVFLTSRHCMNTSCLVFPSKA